MALSDELLEQANHLANREPKRPRQADLRRAVSTAYYSLFHLRVSSAISQWKSPQQRAQIARGFEHSAMKEDSKTQVDPADDHLKIVDKAFAELQQHRHAADYSYVKKWSRTEVQSHVGTSADALTSWKIIQMKSWQQITSSRCSSRNTDTNSETLAS